MQNIKAFLFSLFQKKENSPRRLTLEDIPPEVIRALEDRWYRNLDFQRLYQPVNEPFQWVPIATLIGVFIAIVVSYVR